MQTIEQRRAPLHPLLAVASGAVILVSGLATAALLGWLPASGGKQAEPLAVASASLAPAQGSEPGGNAQRNAQIPQRKTPVAARRASVDKRAASEAAPVEERAASEAPPVEKRAAIEAPRMAQAKPCEDCGVVESVVQADKKGEGSGLGAVGGAVLGGVLGNQVGGGSGRSLMTVVGAVGGGIAGHQIEKKVRATQVHEVTVRMDDGTRRIVTEPDAPRWRIGDKVRIVAGRIEAGAP